jgi:multidrug efflux pump subunit AcrB
MSEMDEATQPGEMPTQPTADGAMPSAQPGTDPSQELEQIRAALKKANNEAAKYRKLADEQTAQAKAKEDAELTEMERLKRQVAEYETRVKQADKERMQRKVGAEAGLPEVLALRLQGDDEDAMREDAKAILATLPKKPTTPTLSATNPGNGQPPTETDAQRRARLQGMGSDPFSVEGAARMGGGVFFQSKETA